MKKVFLFLAVSLVFACSSDSDSVSNGFTFDGQSFQSKYCWIADYTFRPEIENAGIFLINKYFTEDGDVGRNTVELMLDNAVAGIGTYDIVDHRFATDVVSEDSMVISETIITDADSDNEAYHATGTVTINSINESSVSLSYQLTRSDGKQLQGHYTGSYVRPQL